MGLLSLRPPVHTMGHEVTNAESYHEPPHPLLLNSFIFLLLFPLCVGVVCGHCLREFLNFASDRSVIFFEILGMLKNAVEVFLQRQTQDKTTRQESPSHFPKRGKTFKAACLKPRGHNQNSTVTVCLSVSAFSV